MLQTSAIVHETYLKLVDQRQVNWENRRHFFLVASEIMRRILVDYARARNRRKRGGDIEMLTLGSALRVAAETSEVNLLELDDALNKLAKKDLQQAKVVELRYFGGCTVEETAAILGIAQSTVKRDWAVAKAWLRKRLSESR
jgi:RNA polymerase sigma factor (TIGR02999 family)